MIERSTWRAQPWKNGGGVTHEIWREPDTDDFDVRVSLAEVTASGPFSQFVGYRRWTFLVGPAPIALGTIELVAPGDHVELPAEESIDAVLRAGPTHLLNILARVPIVAGHGPVGHPVRFMFDLALQTARLIDPPAPCDTAGCVWIG